MAVTTAPGLAALPRTEGRHAHEYPRPTADTSMILLLQQSLEPLIPELIRSAGAAGILLALMFVTGWVVAGRTSQRWEERYDKVVEKLEAKDEYLVREVVPLLVRAVEVIGRFTEQGRDG